MASKAEAPVGFRHLVLVRVTDRHLYPGLDEYGAVYSVDVADEELPDGMDPIARYELPRPMNDQELTRWFAESDAALEWLDGEIGRETAEQLREETRDSPFYPEPED